MDTIFEFVYFISLSSQVERSIVKRKLHEHRTRFLFFLFFNFFLIFPLQIVQYDIW